MSAKRPPAPPAAELPEAQPGDVWIMRNIIHDWSDEEAAKILAVGRSLAGRGTR